MMSNLAILACVVGSLGLLGYFITRKPKSAPNSSSGEGGTYTYTLTYTTEEEKDIAGAKSVEVKCPALAQYEDVGFVEDPMYDDLPKPKKSKKKSKPKKKKSKKRK